MPIEWKNFSKLLKAVDKFLEFPLLTRASLAENPSLFSDPTKDKKQFFDDGVILLLNKPVTWTSFDAVNKIRILTKAKRVGHCGTLDPFASGLLIVCSGKATKIAAQFSALDKAYSAEFEFGKTTDTLDIDGKVLEQKSVRGVDLVALRAVVEKFSGEIEQMPPQFSAIKINGVPSYRKARKGEAVDHQPRKITIHAMTIHSYENSIAQITVHCSKGTYIRALARDMGELFGCGAFVKSLRRTTIGGFQIGQAVTIDEIKNYLSPLQNAGC